MPDRNTHVIVGAGLAGAKAAEALRAHGFDGRIVLIGAEPELPYERPPLSKEFLRGESSREDARVHPERFYRDAEIELRTGTMVSAIDLAARTLTLADSERIRWDRLLLTTGAEPRRLRVPGADLEGVHYLRDLADAEALRGALGRTERLVVVGAGWIGAEVAASARQLGVEVSLVEQADLPLEPVLGPELGAFYADVHRDRGVAFHTGAKVAGFEGDGRVTGVRLAAGRVLECDLAVVGVGVIPRAELAERAGLEVDDGIVVSPSLATSAPGVFAAGDVASAWHPFYERRLRVEHWANALHQPDVAAQAMLGMPARYERLPYFFSDQYEVGMEYVGYATRWDEVVLRGDLLQRAFMAFWLAGGRVIAGMAVGIWEQADLIEALIRSGQFVDVGRLRDPEVPLDLLAPVPS